MTDIGAMSSIPAGLRAEPAARPSAGQETSALGQKFEELLWAEMLSHAGLEKAFTQSGGEDVSAFSRFIVEAIAEDLARRHPLGLDPLQGLQAAADQSVIEGEAE